MYSNKTHKSRSDIIHQVTSCVKSDTYSFHTLRSLKTNNCLHIISKQPFSSAFQCCCLLKSNELVVWGHLRYNIIVIALAAYVDAVLATTSHHISKMITHKISTLQGKSDILSLKIWISVKVCRNSFKNIIHCNFCKPLAQNNYTIRT